MLTHTWKYTVFFTFTVLLLVTAAAAHAAPPYPPAYRIAYMEAGHFWLYKYTYDAFKAALSEKEDIVAHYPKELYVSLGWEGSQEDLKNEARRILEAKPDLILAAGTGAVRALLAVNNGKTPILGIALADPIAAKVMKSPTEAVARNLICEVIPDRWKNMYRVFHDVVRFKALGIMYPEGRDGRIYGGVDDALAVSREAGFTVVEVIIPDETDSSCRQGIEALHQKGADAFFIGPLNCFDWSATDPTPLMNLLHSYSMPTFARDGSAFVQGGALMGFSTWNFSPTGRKLANAAAAIFNGVAPDELNLTGISEPLIALNLETARKLGFNPPFDVLVVADEIYEKTSKPVLE